MKINTAEIICVGTELLTGKTLNSNAFYLARQLNNLGINNYYQIVVGDNPQRLKQAIEDALMRADCVLLTGGLGPTEDDITMQVVAEVANIELLYDKHWALTMERYIRRLNMPITKNNYKQAYLPRGAKIMTNDNGTAAGAIVTTRDNKFILTFPGPPNELRPMFEQQAVDWLKNYIDWQFNNHYFKLAGIGESQAVTKIADLIDEQGDVTIATYVDGPEISIRVTERRQEHQVSEDFKNILAEIRKRLQSFIFNEDLRSLSQVLAAELSESDLTVAFAESCTAGLACATLADNRGCSKYLLGGVVAYDNRIKHEQLAVSEEVLNDFGSVSEPCAISMAKGIRKRFSSDIGVSITGFAGPDSSETTAVGTVFIAVDTSAGNTVQQYNFAGNRQKVRANSAFYALHALLLTVRSIKSSC